MKLRSKLSVLIQECDRTKRPEILTRDQLLDEEEERSEVTIGQADEGAPRIDERSSEGDDEYDPELKKPVIKTISDAEKVAQQLRDFAQFISHQELSLTLSKVKDLIHEIKLQKPKQQTLISDYFSS